MKQVLFIVAIAMSVASFAQSDVNSKNRSDTGASIVDTKFTIQLNGAQAGMLLGILNTAKINGADKNMMMQFLYMLQTISMQLEEQKKNKTTKKPE